MALSHYLNQCCNIVNRTLGNKLQRHSNRNSNIFFKENAFENVLKIAVILSQPQCVNNKDYSLDKWIQIFPININILLLFLFNILTIDGTQLAQSMRKLCECKLLLMFYLCSSQAEYNTEYIVLYYQGNPLRTGTTKGIKSIKEWLIHGEMGHNISV